MHKIISFFLGLLASGPAFADLATSQGHANDTVHLFYVESGRLTRATCPGNTILYDHAHCQADLGTVSAADAIAGIDEFFARGLNDLISHRDELYTKLLRDDTQLDVYLNSSTPTGDVTGIQQAIKALQTARDQLTSTINDLSDQIARIQAALEAHPDPDLAAQLATLAEQLAAKRKALAGNDRDLSILRGELVNAYASLGASADFQQVWHARVLTADELASTEASITEQLEETAVGKRCAHHLLDPGYTWEILDYSAGEGVGGAWDDVFANVLDDAYEGLPHG